MSFVTIEIKQGKLKGKKNLDIYKNEYCSFEGIPYGKPPIGELRFKPPVPADPWEGEFDATIGTKVCPSILNMQAHPGLIDEDCLRVNVYTPVDLTQKCENLLPVMVHVHGGAFVVGSSIREELGPDFLMNKNVVLVTFNYRLGVLGFFSLNDIELNVTGNAGCKDMVEALKWVKNNISNFGGDPYNVTLFGESAGGVAVSLLLISHLARGLFHKVIVQSGSVICPWTASNSNSLASTNKLFLEKLKCNTSDPKKILEFLQSKTFEELSGAEYHIFNSKKTESIELKTFYPIVEVNHETAFLTEDPEESMKNGSFFKCPTIAGFLNNDGIIMESFGMINSNFKSFNNLLPRKVLQENDSSELERITKKFQSFYYKNEVPSFENKHIYEKILTDIYFGMPMVKFAQYLTFHSSYPTYLYKFFLTSKVNKVAGELNHLDDARYIFSTITTKDMVTIGSIEEKAINLMTTMWTNFAKTNNPNPLPNNYHNVEWEPIIGSKLNYLHIDHYPRLGEDPDGSRFRFMETLFAS